jgi:hypothetical protein
VPQSWSGASGEEKKMPSLTLPGIEPARSLVTMLTELCLNLSMDQY